ncbi:MAG: RnfABCDGE type electron transport complex subunit B [Spirochaetaceae bacterium]|jgi:Na+-translocating ferredoxin:NAD+ oxidoreductase RNF subunit RnfB|nr:RnfABCDGE type electron transport complex subunit B [Spirochaetaceae bacterium]
MTPLALIESMPIIFITGGFAALLALILGLALGLFRELFKVEEDPLTGRIREALPGANCGGCGFPGCDGYAAAVAAGGDISLCTAGGKATADMLAEIMGAGVVELTALAAVCCCIGENGIAAKRGIYTGLESCRGAKIAGGTKFCLWGCIGFGDCVRVCKFDAITMGPGGLPVVDRTKCTGCKACAAECPQAVLRLVPRDQESTLTLCSNRNPLRAAIRKTCRLGCIKCGICVKTCPEQCIVIEDGIPVVDRAKCTACGACEEKCPTRVVRVLRGLPVEPAAASR